MSTADDEQLVRRFDEDICNGRPNGPASELFVENHVFPPPATAFVLRWTGWGRHTVTLNGIPLMGRQINVDAISIHHITGGKIAETRTVWDTLGLLQRLGVVPAAA